MSRPSLQRLLVPVDGSDAAQAAIELALRLAPNGDLIFAHAIDRVRVIAECTTMYGGDATPALDALEADERDVLRAAMARAQAAHGHAATESLDGDAGIAIVALARTRAVDAIVMGTHGRSGFARALLGSTAESTVRRADVPVFVTRGARSAANGDAAFRSVIAAVDGSASARLAARYAAEIATASAAHLHLVHVADGTLAPAGITDVLARAVDEAAGAGIRADSIVVHGTPAEAVLIAAETLHADLIAIGTHGRRGLTRLALGSVAERIVRTSRAPVMTVPEACAARRGRILYAAAT